MGVKNSPQETIMDDPVEVTESQREKIQEFRDLVKDVVPSEQLRDDRFLLRWLIAREFNLEKASVMLKNFVEWKEAKEIDKVLEWSPPEELKEACPFDVLDKDMEGRPVLFFPWGSWKPWVFTEKYLNVYQKYMDYMIHSVITRMRPPATQFVIVGDSDGFTYGHMKYIKALEVNLEAVRQFEAHYPELMHSAIVINCPSAFTLLFSLIKPLMSKRTRNKIHLFGCDQIKWKEFLAQKIPHDQLPSKYRMGTESP